MREGGRNPTEPWDNGEGAVGLKLQRFLPPENNISSRVNGIEKSYENGQGLYIRNMKMLLKGYSSQGEFHSIYINM